MSVNKFGQHSGKIRVGFKRGPPGHGFNLDSNGDFDIKNKKLVNVADATLSNDAVNKHMLDNLKAELKSDIEKLKQEIIGETTSLINIKKQAVADERSNVIDDLKKMIKVKNSYKLDSVGETSIK